jgi:hypothetical protein
MRGLLRTDEGPTSGLDSRIVLAMFMHGLCICITSWLVVLASIWRFLIWLCR